MDDAARLLATLEARGSTLAVAESLTGGLLAGLLTSVAGASAVVRGGVVAYASDVKVSLLGVPASVVDEHGVVSAACASAMAEGVRDVLRATYGLSTTGVAGPDTQEGRPVGTVYVGVAGPDGASAVELHLAGDRAAIRGATCERAVQALLSALG